jgi:hypothetical protein
MTNAVTRTYLALSLVLFAAGPALTQTPSDEAKPETTAPSPVANVYVQINSGVNVYNANASGELTLVKGSPFADTGQMEGNNGGYLISVGTDYLHSYKIESNGAVGPQASEINTQSYAGSECGSTFDASIFDHTGQYFSVQLYGSTSDPCSALQTYKLASNGEFTFLGDTVSTDGVHGTAYQQAVSTYSSNDTFAYGAMSTQGATVFDAFKRGAAGDLVENTSFNQSGPSLTLRWATTSLGWWPQTLRITWRRWWTRPLATALRCNWPVTRSIPARAPFNRPTLMRICPLWKGILSRSTCRGRGIY